MARFEELQAEESEWDESSSLHFSIDFDIDNRRLTSAQRKAIRTMVKSFVDEAFIKCILLVGDQRTVTVYGEERSSLMGTRRIEASDDGDH